MIGNVTRQILHLVDEAAEEVDDDGQQWPVVDDEVDADEDKEEEPGGGHEEEYIYEEGRKAHLLGFFSAKAKVAWPTSPASKGDPVASSHTNPKDSSRSIDQFEIALVDPSMVYLWLNVGFGVDWISWRFYWYVFVLNSFHIS